MSEKTLQAGSRRCLVLGLFESSVRCVVRLNVLAE